jgi:hypothetical protein
MQIRFDKSFKSFDTINDVRDLITEDTLFSQKDLLEAKLKRKDIKIFKIEKANDETIVYLTKTDSKLLLE